MKPSHYIAAIILLLISLIFCDGFHITKRLDDEPDPIWFSDIDLNKGQGLAFAFESDDSYASSSTSVEGPERELSWKDLSDEEKSLWNRLLNREDKLINTYMILNKLLHLRKGQNFRYEGVSSGDIETLIKLKPIRMSGCSPIRLKERRSLFEGSVLATKPKLAEYLNLTYNRQLRFCSFLVDRLAAHGIRNLPLHENRLMSELKNDITVQLPDYNLEYGIPRTGRIIRVIADFFVNNAITSPIFWPTINDPIVKTVEFRNEVLRVFGPICSLVEDGMGDIVEYVDTIYPLREPIRDKIRVQSYTRYWIAVTRLCRLLLIDPRVTDLILADLRIRSPRRMLPASVKRLIVTVPDQWLPPAIDKMNNVKIGRDESQFVEIRVSDIRENPNIFKKFTFDESLELVIDHSLVFDIQEEEDLSEYEIDQWRRLENNTNANLYDYAVTPLKNLSQLHAGKRLAYKNITSEDIHELIGLRDSRITYCSYKMLVYRWEKYRDPRLSDMPTMKRYIDTYFYRQVALCWALIDLMIEENVFEMHPKTRVAMKGINIHDILRQGNDQLDKSVESNSVDEAIAEFIIRNPIYKHKYRELISSHRAFTPLDLIDVLGDIFDGHCKFVGDALNDIINYLDLFRDFWDQVDLNFNSKLWIAYGRICRGFSRVHRIYIKVKAYQKDIDGGQIFDIQSDGLTFIIGPQTTLVPQITGINYDNPARQIQRIQGNEEFLNLINSKPASRYGLTILLGRLLKKYPDENIKIGTLTSYQIETLLRIQPLRLANCLIDNMRIRTSLMENFVIDIPKLKEYFDHYNQRQMDICLDIFEALVENRSREVGEYVKYNLKRVHNLINYNSIDLLPKTPDISINSIRVIVGGLVSHHDIRKVLLTIEEPKVMSSNQFHELLSDSVGSGCIRLDMEAGELLDYYDEFFGTNASEQVKVNLKSGTILRLSDLRFCRLLFTSKSLFKDTYEEFIRQAGLLKPPDDTGIVKIKPSTYWFRFTSQEDEPTDNISMEPSSSSWADIVSDEEEEEEKEKAMTNMLRLDDGRFREKNTTYPVSYGTGYYWFTTNNDDFNDIQNHRRQSWNFITSPNFKRLAIGVHLEDLIYPLNKNDQMDEIDRADIRTFINFKPTGLINCSSDKIIELEEFRNNLVFKIYPSLSEYNEYYSKFQIILCRRYFQNIIRSNYSDITERIKIFIEKVKDEIKSFCADEFGGFVAPQKLSCIHYSIARILYRLHRPTQRQIDVGYVDSLGKSVFIDAYRALEYAFGDFIDLIRTLEFHRFDTTRMLSPTTNDYLTLTAIFRGFAKDMKFRRFIYPIFKRMLGLRVIDQVRIPNDWYMRMKQRESYSASSSES